MKNLFTIHCSLLLVVLMSATSTMAQSSEKLKMGASQNTAANIAVYPNPVSGNSFNLQLNNMPKGTFIINMVDRFGHLILSRQEELNNNVSVTQNIEWSQIIAPGIYYLLVKGEGVKLTGYVVKN